MFSTIRPAAFRRQWRAGAVAFFLPAVLVTAACASNKTAGAGSQTSQPSQASQQLTSAELTPVPPAALATLPPPTPRPGATAQAASGPSVAIDNFNFTPATITVPVGATVTWTNHDDVPHTVTASDKSFTSQALNTDTQFTYTFTTAGTYSYFCSIHPFMTAKVIVQ